MPGYDYEVSRAAFVAVLACANRDIIRLYQAIEFLAENPHCAADFYGLDFRGRAVCWRKAGPFAVGYLADHANKVIHILDIQRVLN